MKQKFLRPGKGIVWLCLIHFAAGKLSALGGRRVQVGIRVSDIPLDAGDS